MCTFIYSGTIDVYDWLSEEKLEILKEDREPADAPNCPNHKPNPDKLGKLLWFSGAPGTGKSTCAHLMGRQHGYVYYEVDCFNNFVNPFINPNIENPSLQQFLQSPLKVKHIVFSNI